MKVNRIDIDLSKSPRISCDILDRMPMNFLIVRNGDKGYCYNTFDQKTREELILELKIQGVYVSEDEVSIYSAEGFTNTLDYLYEHSVTETFTVKDYSTGIINTNGVFNIILN